MPIYTYIARNTIGEIEVISTDWFSVCDYPPSQITIMIEVSGFIHEINMGNSVMQPCNYQG